jgi:hypothetical protein
LKGPASWQAAIGQLPRHGHIATSRPYRPIGHCHVTAIENILFFFVSIALGKIFLCGPREVQTASRLSSFKLHPIILSRWALIRSMITFTNPSCSILGAVKKKKNLESWLFFFY